MDGFGIVVFFFIIAYVLIVSSKFKNKDTAKKFSQYLKTISTPPPDPEENEGSEEENKNHIFSEASSRQTNFENKMNFKKEEFMFSGIPTLIFFVVLIIGGAFSFGMFQVNNVTGVVCFIISFFLAILASSAVRVAAQWERGIVLRLGKFLGIKGPGLFFIIPVVDNVMVVDIRVLTLDIPKQQVITKDNVPVSINGVIYFKVAKVEDAIVQVQNYSYAMSQYALAALRDVVGGMTLDQLLSEREQISKEIETIVEKESRNWGLEVTTIKIQDIDMPEDLKKMMSRQASAEREKRANITKAEGDKLAAINLAAAAETMLKSPGAMQLRTLQTVDGLGPSPSNTVILVPIELMEAFKNIIKKPSE